MGLAKRRKSFISTLSRWGVTLCFVPLSAVAADLDVFAQIRTLIDQKKHPEILVKVDENLPKAKSDSEKALLWMARANAAMELKDWEKSKESLQEAIKLKTSLDEYAYFYLGQIANAQNNFAEAKRYWNEALKMSPNMRLESETRYHLSLIENEMGHYRDAKNYLSKQERKQRREESYPEIIYQLARAERGLGNGSQFCRWTRKLFSNYPDFYRINTWGPQLSQNVFEGKATNCGTDFEDVRSRIRNLQWAGQTTKAFDEIQKLKAGPWANEAFLADRLLVHFYMQDGEVEKALALFKPYYAQKRNDFNYLLTMSSVLARSGEGPAAVGAYYQAYKLSPRSKKGKQALFQAAFLSYQFQDYDGAARRFKEFIKIYPNSGLSRDAQWHLAWIRYLRADYEGSLKALNALTPEKRKRRRQARTSGQERIQYWRAMSMYKLGQIEPARLLFENIAKDQSLGFYSLAANHRLKQLESQNSRPIKRQLGSTANRLRRFSAAEILLPVDDWNQAPLYTESEESEENMVAMTTDVSAEESEEEVEEIDADSGPGDDSKLNVASDENPFDSSKPALLKKFERARDLMIIGLNDWAKWDLYEVERRTSNREYLKTLMGEYEKVGYFHRSSYIAQVTFGSQRASYGIEGVRYLWEYAFPQAYAPFVKQYAQKFEIPMELVWGIMRAESTYRRDVVSPVGALGLMQIMPHTGFKVSQLLSDKSFESKQLLDPEQAVRIGSKYLSRLMRKFDNNFVLVAAGYNAGPHRVRQWLNSFGHLDFDEFVEHIPFVETRNYVKKVITNMNVYYRLYGTKNEMPISLSSAIKVKTTDASPFKETWDDI